MSKGVTLGHGLDNDQKDSLAATVKQIVYEQDEVIFDSGEPGAAAFVIKSVRYCKIRVKLS